MQKLTFGKNEDTLHTRQPTVTITGDIEGYFVSENDMYLLRDRAQESGTASLSNLPKIKMLRIL